MSRIVLKVSVHEKVIFPHHHMADDEQQRLQQNVSTSYDPLRTILSRLLSPFGAVPSAPTAPQSLQTQNTPYNGNNTHHSGDNTSHYPPTINNQKTKYQEQNEA